jgi:hypothetical protein
MISRCPIRLTTLKVLILLVLLGVRQAPAQTAGGVLKSITVSFRFDPGPTYGGVRWVPPPFTSGIQVGQVTVDAKVQGVDSQGKPVAITPEWTPANAELVSVSPIRGDEYRIAVKHAGECKLRVSAGQVSRDLFIKAKPLGDGKALQVQVSSVGVEMPAATASVQDEPKTEAIPQPADSSSAFGSEKEKQSYALGINTASQLRNRSIDVDTELFMRGFKDTIVGGKMLLTEQDVRAVIINLRMEEKKKQLALKQEKQAAGKLREIKTPHRNTATP